MGDLLNQGTINVDDPDASIQRAEAGFPDQAVQVNQGTVDISAGNALGRSSPTSSTAPVA